jgi:hypothetical protein
MKIQSELVERPKPSSSKGVGSASQERERSPHGANVLIRRQQLSKSVKDVRSPANIERVEINSTDTSALEDRPHAARPAHQSRANRTSLVR